MSGYTKGPWEYGVARNYCGYYIAPKGTLPTLAAVERCGTNMSVSTFNFPGETEANARLIAAAPELLEALKDQRQLMVGYKSRLECDGAYVAARQVDDRIEMVSAVIAKAEGL